MSSQANHAFCRDLGATRTLDYADPEGLSGEFDVVVDCHGAARGSYRRLLRSRGG